MNPLQSGDPTTWDRLIEAVGPARILVSIDLALRGPLSTRTTAEDIWQDTLLLAWRKRESFEWRGLSSLRGWLLEIARNRTRDLAEHYGAVKRGGELSPIGAAAEDGSARSLADVLGPLVSTTPSRVAALSESAARMRAALGSLSDDNREVVRLRLFEERSMQEIAGELGLGVEAVRHRFRKGFALYAATLREKLGENPSTNRDGERRGLR